MAATTGDARWPSLHVGEGGRGEIRRGDSLFRPVAASCWDPAVRLAAMDGAGIDVQVLSPVPITLTTWAEPRLAASFARRQNEQLAKAVAGAPNRLAWMASVPLQDVGLAVAELELAERNGAVGVEIGATVGDAELDDASLSPFFEAAEDLNVPLLVHPTDGGTGSIRRSGSPFDFGLGMLTDTAMAAGALVFGGVLERFPGLRVALAHGCGTFAWSWPRLRRGASIGPSGRTDGQLNVLDELVRRLWADSLVFDAAHLPLLFERFGSGHVVLGSDFPFYPPSFGSALAVLEDGIRSGCCSPEQADAVRTTNGRRFLGLTTTGDAR